MSKKRRVIVVHGWRDSPENAWMQWLGAELKARGFEVVAPALPSPRVPRLAKWVETVSAAAGPLDSRTVIVAHSLGVPTTLRFLNDYPYDVKIAGVVLVAGFGKGIKNRPAALFSPPLDFGRIIARTRTRVSIYSDNDHVVPPRMTKQLAASLEGREVEVLGAGHFIGQNVLPGSVDQVPAVLEAVLSCYPPMWRQRLSTLLSRVKLKI